MDALRVAVRRRMVADVPVGILLSGGLDSSLIVALLAEQGQRGLATFSVGFEDVGDREGDEFEFSDLVAAEFGTDHHQIRVGPERLLPALPRAIAAMSEPMVSHDAVAFFLLSEEVSRQRKVVQSGQGADEVFGGYYWYPPLLEADGDGLDVYADAFFDRDDAGVRRAAARALGGRRRPVARAGDDVVRRARARRRAIDRGLRLDAEVMLVDDPVKRVDNMTMAHGLEARTPFLDHELVELAALCPPELKLADGGKGVLKRGARGCRARRGDRPAEGLLPRPRAVAPGGAGARAGAATRCARTRRARAGCSARTWSRRCSPARTSTAPTSTARRCGSSGCLELWLQEHVD